MTIKTAAQIVADAEAQIPDNNSRFVTPERVRQRIIDLAESTAFPAAMGFTTPEEFGAVGNGIADDTAAIVAAEATGLNLLFPYGKTYLMTSQVTITAPGLWRRLVTGYGAILKTTGAISALQVTDGGSIGGVTVCGLHVDHRNNADATAGFEAVFARYAVFQDCAVEANGVNADYGAFLLREEDPEDPNTGTFWTQIINPMVRKRSGADPGAISFGVRLVGAANATNIRGGALSSVGVGVSIENASGETYVSNGVLVDGTAIEVYTTGCRIVGATTSNLAGHRFTNMRFESGTTVFSIEGVESPNPTFFVPPYMAGNYCSTSAGTYLNNPNDIEINSIDYEHTPEFWAFVNGL